MDDDQTFEEITEGMVLELPKPLWKRTLIFMGRMATAFVILVLVGLFFAMVLTLFVGLLYVIILWMAWMWEMMLG